MDMQKRNSQITVVTIAVVCAVVVAGAAYWWHVSRSPLTVSTTNQTSVQESTGPWKTILATLIPPGEDRSDANDREVEYKVFSIQAPKLDEEQLGTLRANIFVDTLQYVDGNVYFVNGDGEFSFYNLATKKIERVALPDIKPVFGFLDEHSVYDFAFEDATKLVYLQGGCSDGAACSLKEYDFTTKKSSSIIDHLEKKFAINGETTIKIRGVDAFHVDLIRTRNTADGGFADVISIALDSHQDKVTQTVNFTADQKSPEADKLFTKNFVCGDVSAEQKLVNIPDSGDAEIQTTVSAQQGAMTKKYHPTYTVGCVMPK